MKMQNDPSIAAKRFITLYNVIDGQLRAFRYVEPMFNVMKNIIMAKRCYMAGNDNSIEFKGYHKDAYISVEHWKCGKKANNKDVLEYFMGMNYDTISGVFKFLRDKHGYMRSDYCTGIKTFKWDAPKCKVVVQDIHVHFVGILDGVVYGVNDIHNVDHQTREGYLPIANIFTNEWLLDTDTYHRTEDECKKANHVVVIDFAD